MKYEQIYNMLNNVYNFTYKNDYLYEDYNTLYENILKTYTDDIPVNIILKNFHIKNLAIQGITFNNIHLQTDSNLFQNFLKCLHQKEIYNKKICRKPIHLYLYYDIDKFDINELYKLESFDKFINKKTLYTYNYDIYMDLNTYLTDNNFEIVYLIKEECELFGYKQQIQIEINDDNIQNMKKYFELINSMDYNKTIYTTINSKITSTINEYFKILKEMQVLYTDKQIINKSYLIGEHIGIDENNNFYMKLHTENFYPSDEKSFQDYYIKYNNLSEPCLNCDDCIYCITNTLDKQCPHKKTF